MPTGTYWTKDHSFNETIDQPMSDSIDIVSWTSGPTGKFLRFGDTAPAGDTKNSYRNTNENVPDFPSSMFELEPTPLGPQIEVVESIDICDGLGHGYSSLYYSLGQAEMILSEDSKRTEPPQKKRRRSTGSTPRPARKIKKSSKQRSSWMAEGPFLPDGFTSSDVVQNRLTQVTGLINGPQMKEDPSFSAEGNEKNRKFRTYQSENWTERYQDLVRFREEHGHCYVPHDLEENPALSSWIKRQRYQYKLKQEGKHNTLTEKRQAQLEALGFIWDSHKAIWEERYQELCEYTAVNGHSNVPSKHSNKTLAIWVKCQRRQFKLHKDGKKSSMCPKRIEKLERLNFVWKPLRGQPGGKLTKM